MGAGLEAEVSREVEGRKVEGWKVGRLPLVPKLPLGNALPRSSASQRVGRHRLGVNCSPFRALPGRAWRRLRSQAGAWERGDEIPPHATPRFRKNLLDFASAAG
jgi:hypothetical protein